jgi:hypothetical protein
MRGSKCHKDQYFGLSKIKNEVVAPMSQILRACQSKTFGKFPMPRPGTLSEVPSIRQVKVVVEHYWIEGCKRVHASV